MKEIMGKIGEISFISFDEIYEMRAKARKLYQKFDYDTKEIYKWYYYHQLCIMKSCKKEPLKDYLWLYISGREDMEEVLTKEYDKFSKKRQNIRINEEKPIKCENISIFEILSYKFD